MSETVLYKNDAVKKLKKRAKVRREIRPRPAATAASCTPSSAR